MTSEELRMRGTTALDVPDLPGTIHPFSQPQTKGIFRLLLSELKSITSEKQARKILFYCAINLLGTMLLFVWCSSTNSMALTAYTYLTIFDLFSLGTCLLTIWVRQQKSSPIYSFGYARFEVLAVFASTILAILGALFIMKESIERMVQQPDIHTGRLIIGVVVAFVLHMILTYTADNQAFNHVIAASSSSWLQEHVSDISQSICSVIPGLSKLLLPRINPLPLIGCAGATALVVAYMLIDMYNYHAADTWAAVWIALMTIGTMFPMSVYTGKILLQTTPSHIIGQLDKCIREASTLDGVLEFRNEHFWTLSFGTLSGSVHVRIRRDADEQMVLAHVCHRLSNVVSVLSVQIFKDDWARPSSTQILGDKSLFPPSLMTSTTMNNHLTSSVKQGLAQNIAFNSSTYSPGPVGASLSQGSYGASIPPIAQTSPINTSHLNKDILRLLGSNNGAYSPQNLQNSFNMSPPNQTANGSSMK